MQEIEELIASDAGEDQIKEKLEEKLSLEEDAEQKLQGYYHILRELKEHENACESEIEVLEKSKSRAKSAREGLEQNVKFYLENVEGTDEKRIGTAHFRVNKVGGRRSLKTPGDKSEYPRSTKKWKITIDVDGAEVSAKEHDAIMSMVRNLAMNAGVTVKTRERLMKSRVREEIDPDSSLVEYAERATKLKYD